MKIFITGIAGEGKTTIANLIMRILNLNGIRGQIICDTRPELLADNDFFNRCLHNMHTKMSGKVIDIIECQEHMLQNDYFTAHSQIPDRSNKQYQIKQSIDTHE